MNPASNLTAAVALMALGSATAGPAERVALPRETDKSIQEERLRVAAIKRVRKAKQRQRGMG